jgi:hypothetical protein
MTVNIKLIIQGLIQAIKNGEITIEDVPEIYKEEVEKNV